MCSGLTSGSGTSSKAMGAVMSAGAAPVAALVVAGFCASAGTGAAVLLGCVASAGAAALFTTVLAGWTGVGSAGFVAAAETAFVELLAVLFDVAEAAGVAASVLVPVPVCAVSIGFGSAAIGTGLSLCTNRCGSATSTGRNSGPAMITRMPIVGRPHSSAAKLCGMRTQPCDAW